MILRREVVAALCWVGLVICFSRAESGAPFPDVWNSNPLQSSDTAVDSLISPPTLVPEKIAPEIKIVPSLDSVVAQAHFQLPPAGHAALRVLIAEHSERGSLSARTGILVLWLKSDGGTGRTDFQNRELQMERSGEGFRISAVGSRDVSIDASSIRLSPENPVVPLQLNGKAYRGSLDLYSDGAGFQVVNVLPMEEYLRGVVPLEMGQPRETGLEALKAQAVVARTYAFKSMLAAEGNQFFDLRASTQDQVYGGVSAEYGLADSAIRATRGRVLLHGDTLTRCYYHSTCGGMTASRHEVWNGPSIPYLISQPDTDANGIPWCHLSKHMHWEQSWDVDELAGILRANLGAAGINPVPTFRRITELNVRDRFSDGRVKTLEVKTDQGSFELHGDRIRFAFKSTLENARILRSARFDIVLDGDRVTVRGSGNGHGVGMCQMGALSRSAAGQSYEEILTAYYPGTRVEVAK